MGWFNKDKNKNTADVASAPQASATPAAATGGVIDLGKKTGKIDLTKGSRVTIAKTPIIRAKATWSSNTDYDLYAIVLLKNGKQLVVSTFGSKEQPSYTDSVLNGAVRHLGDVGRGAPGIAEETIEIKMTDDILAVVPIAYSAQSNGTGSFRRYKVSLSLDNGAGDTVTIDSRHANNNDNIYTVAIGVITNEAEGVSIEGLELYSAPGSEKRPAFVKGKIVMDAGSHNLYK